MRALVLFGAIVACNNLLLFVVAKTFSGIHHTFSSRQIDGQIYSWGAGTSGQLGHGAFANSVFPVKMLNVQYATNVSAGESHTCIMDQGKVRCTGHTNFIGRFIISTHTNTLVDVEGVNYSVETVEQIFVGQAHSCLVTSAGGAKCWGSNWKGQLGSTTALQFRQAFSITGFETNGVSTMALGSYHTCLLNTMGKVYCAGENESGQLGRGTKGYNMNTAMQPVTSEETMVSIASGPLHVCALSNMDRLYCWGHGGYGQLGQGNTTYMYVPAIVPGLSNVALISCGWHNTFTLLKNDQGVKAFGFNQRGELGLGSDDTNQLSPVMVFAGETNIVDIQGGRSGACIKIASCAIRCYGRDGYGQLGNGELSEYFSTFVDVLYLPVTPSPTALPTASPTSSPSALPTTQPTLVPTQLPTSSPTLTTAPTLLPTASPTTLLPTASPTTIITAEQDLSLVGLVALVPVLAVLGAVAYCKFVKPTATTENITLQVKSSPV